MKKHVIPSLLVVAASLLDLKFPLIYEFISTGFLTSIIVAYLIAYNRFTLKYLEKYPSVRWYNISIISVKLGVGLFSTTHALTGGMTLEFIVSLSMAILYFILVDLLLIGGKSVVTTFTEYVMKKLVF